MNGELLRGAVWRIRSPRDGQGHEQRGRRYAVIVQSNDLWLSTALVAPTSTSARPANYRPEVTVRGQQTLVLVDQMRAVDTEKGLDTQVGTLSLDDMRQVDQALRIALDLYR